MSHVRDREVVADPPSPDPWCAAAAVLEALPEPLLVSDTTGRVVMANTALASLVGQPREVLVADLAACCVDTDLGTLAGHLAAPGPTPAVCHVLGLDGRPTTVRLVASPLAGDGDGPRGWLHRVHTPDVPEAPPTVQAELVHLRRQHELLNEAQAIARIGSWEWDALSDVISWSDELYRVFGVDPRTYRPDRFSMVDLIHADHRARYLSTVARVDEQVAGPLPEFEGRLAGDEGRPRWIRIRGSSTVDDAGRPIRLHGTVQDITASKDQENALAFLSVMAGVANQAQTVLEALLAADEHVRPHLQWPIQVVGLPVAPGSDELAYFDVSGDPLLDARHVLAVSLARRAETRRTVVRGMSSSGTLMLAGPVLSQGRLQCVLVVDTLQALEPPPFELACFTQSLALLRSVADRECAARELAEARDLALSGSRAKSEFLATMSHEIRTPLNGVIGLTQLLAGTRLDLEQRRLVEGVGQAGRTLLALVNDILDLSKIEAGRLELESIDFDPGQVVEDSTTLLADRAGEKGLRLTVACDPRLPDRVRGDPVRLGQVITNLVANAVKFTPAGHVTVRARCSSGRLSVEVEDSGVGIRPETRGRLFQAFTQADSSTTRTYGGTGLGLAISHRLVTAMGGAIDVVSEPGAGSTFWFEVPVGHALDRPSEPEEPTPAPVPLTSLGRVLVVEDNEINQLVAEGLLRRLGYEVSVVADGQQALAAVDREPSAFVAVLMDCQMPVMDGYAATRALRERETAGRPRVPVIAMTAAAVAEERERCLAAGMDDFLTKPVDVDQLTRTLERWTAEAPTRS